MNFDQITLMCFKRQHKQNSPCQSFKRKQLGRNREISIISIRNISKNNNCFPNNITT